MRPFVVMSQHNPVWNLWSFWCYACPKKSCPWTYSSAGDKAVWPTSQWVGIMLLWYQQPLKQSDSWTELITLGHLWITVTALQAVTFRFSGGTFWLVGRLTIKLCSVLGIHHHYSMGLSIGSLKYGSSLRLNICLGDTGSTWLHEAKVSWPVG